MENSPVEEIKNKLDIVEVVRDYVTLEKAGSNLRALCPFHAEKSPSFFVNPSRQIWRCFGGCSEGGDMFSFIMRIEGVEFGDALRILAKKAGVELKRQDPKLESKRKRLFDICEIAADFFENQLQKSNKGKEAKDYFLKRGIKEESIKEWKLGYAPTAQDALSKFLIGEGYTKEEIKEAGMATGKENRIYDRFRARIIFPIFNLSGVPVGFGGRTLFENDERAKYINSPSTVLYDKSALLYGMHKAKVGIRREGVAVVVEGYTDVILCYQEGYENTVSSSGTAFTPQQLDMLGRYTETIYTAFDMDEAGNLATKKGIDLARQKDFEVKVIMMPQGKDPADIVKDNPQDWKNYLEKAESIMEFYFKTVLSKHDLSDPREKRKAANEILPEIKKIKNSIERSHYVSKLAYSLRINEETIMEEMQRIKLETTRREEPKKEKAKTRKERLEEMVGSLCVKRGELLGKLNEEDISFLREEIGEILLSLKRKKNPENNDLADYLSTLPEMETELDLEKELEICVKEIKKEKFREDLREAETRLKEAERSDDKKQQEEIMQEINDYSKKLQKI